MLSSIPLIIVVAVVAAVLPVVTPTAAPTTTPGGGATTMPATGPTTAPDARAVLRVMTFNLKYASDRPPHRWADRRPVMAELLHAQKPDLMGTQEGLADQLNAIDADMGPGYARVGRGREADGGGEHSAMFYRVARLLLLEHGDFWLSPTPDKAGSIAWGASLPRLCSWARFRDRQTGGEFVAFNVHFDHASEEARVHSAELLRDRVKAVDPRMPVVVTGDFNAAAGDSAAFTTMTRGADLHEAFATARTKSPLVGTIHDWKPAEAGGVRIDWILLRPGSVAKSAVIDTFSKDGEQPSDHFPVIAEIELNTPTE